jgi:hypothetical protein
MEIVNNEFIAMPIGLIIIGFVLYNLFTHQVNKDNRSNFIGALFLGVIIVILCIFTNTLGEFGTN